LKVGAVGDRELLEEEGERACEKAIEYFEAEEEVVAEEAHEGEDNGRDEVCLREDRVVVCQ
jgi:hypothetical protein